MEQRPKVKIYFSEYFEVDPDVLHSYGAFNVSLINDLPLFIDPFLLFGAQNLEYKGLHDEIIKYVRFLRDKSRSGTLSPGLLKAWFTFPEVKQTWLGFSQLGNAGAGLGKTFAEALNRNLNTIFSSFGQNQISRDSHLEKLCLIDSGVGRDNISDFTTNLIKGYLLKYTETFAKEHLRKDQIKQIKVEKVIFNYSTEKWESRTFELPYIDGDYVILTPRDMLTKEETWINRDDLLGNLEDIVNAVEDDQLRAEMDNYLAQKLAESADEDREPSLSQRKEAMAAALKQFPALLDYYIRWKEQHSEEAEAISEGKVSESEEFFIKGVQSLVDQLARAGFYNNHGDTFEESRLRVNFLKRVIEHQDGYRWFFGKDGKPIRREKDLQLLFRLTWFATISDVNREVNNGRGPVDFKVSRGSEDKSLVEFKLASNKQLKKNLQSQVEIYEEANDTRKSLTVIVYFSLEELNKVNAILTELELKERTDIILIDARPDNKPSGSVA